MDRDIKNKLQRYEAPFDPNDWEQMEGVLLERRERRSIVWPWYLLFAVFALSISGLLIWQQSISNKLTQIPKVKAPISMEIHEMDHQNTHESFEPVLLQFEKSSEVHVSNKSMSAKSNNLKREKASLELSKMPVNVEDNRNVDKLKTPKNNQSLNLLPALEMNEKFVYSDSDNISFPTKELNIEKEEQIIKTAFEVGIFASVLMQEHHDLSSQEYVGGGIHLSLETENWQFGLLPAYLETNGIEEEIWEEYNARESDPVFQNNFQSFSPTTFFRKKVIYKANKTQWRIPFYAGYKLSSGRFSVVFGPQISYSFSDHTANQKFMGVGLRSAIACSLNKNIDLNMNGFYEQVDHTDWERSFGLNIGLNYRW